MALYRALDVSNWSGTVSAEQAQCMAEHGVRLAIPGTQDYDITRQQLGAFNGAGIPTDAYVYLYFSDDPVAQVEAALATCAGYPVGRLWLDCEDEAASALNEEATVDFIQRASDACINRMWTGIYTRKNWWEYQTGNSARFAAWPLWYATNDRLGDLSFYPFGGWTMPFMEQYAFDVVVCGVNTDLNVYREVTPEPPPAPNIQTYETETVYEGHDAQRGHVYRQTTRFGVL
jgi:hypothetical protein